jgi:hypothetical protein
MRKCARPVRGATVRCSRQRRGNTGPRHFNAVPACLAAANRLLPSTVEVADLRLASFDWYLARPVARPTRTNHRFGCAVFARTASIVPGSSLVQRHADSRDALADGTYHRLRRLGSGSTFFISPKHFPSSPRDWAKGGQGVAGAIAPQLRSGSPRARTARTKPRCGAGRSFGGQRARARQSAGPRATSLRP